MRAVGKSLTLLEKGRCLEIFDWALAYLDAMWDQIVGEFESTKTGQVVDSPLCIVMSDMNNEKVIELVGARMLLRQAECFTDRPQSESSYEE